MQFSYRVENGGERVDLFLSRMTSRSRAFVQAQIDAGRVYRNGQKVTKPSLKILGGDTVSGEFVEDERTNLKPIAYDLEVLHEDDHLLAVNKAQGVVVHPAPGHRGETLVHYVLHHLTAEKEFTELSPSRPGIVHRLDRGTSGIILIAKNRKALEELARQFKEREISKEYRAFVWGLTRPSFTIASSIGRDKKDRKRMSSRTTSGREALTRWQRLEGFNHFSYLALFPHTGRTHQLRVHLAENRHPIVGDTLYRGHPTAHRLRGIDEQIKQFLLPVTQPFLHAYRLQFHHPLTGKVMDLQAPLPKHFENFLTLLRGTNAKTP